MALPAIAGFFILVIVGGVGLGVASATPVDDLARSGAFGFDATTHAATQAVQPAALERRSEADSSYFERSALASSSPRDIDAGMQMIDDMERAEQERIAAENAAALERMASEKAKQGVESSADIAEPPAAEAVEYSLPAVDWTVGRDEFIAEWTARIDAYLAGSTLDGYGSIFAEAAWDNGVDPRWSPAVANTESGKGASCFRSHNAWGWGNSAWGDWETAIRAHVAGLANAYGYSITVGAAQIYCPPNWANWYNDTLGQMSLI